MKNAALEKNQEILSMDDELPIILYILLNFKAENLMSQLNMIDDWLSIEGELENEKRILMNYKVILNFLLFF
jgi:hypothetical protein